MKAVSEDIYLPLHHPVKLTHHLARGILLALLTLACHLLRVYARTHESLLAYAEEQ